MASGTFVCLARVKKAINTIAINAHTAQLNAGKQRRKL
jgi:hypothetical protein